MLRESRSEDKSERGREFACHGFSRRLGTMVRAVDLIFDKLPPKLDEIPAKDTVTEATIAIQSFVVNAFGCLDNLALDLGLRGPGFEGRKGAGPDEGRPRSQEQRGARVIQ